MSEGLKQLSPKDGYVVEAKTHIGSTEFKTLVKLYQPLIGVNAYGLYSLLATELTKTPDLTERQLHKDLLDDLSLGLNDFYEARIKLEALGLLRTFEQTDELGHLFIYELQAPQSAKDFFKDDLLSVLLMDALGEKRYVQLKKDFLKPDLKHQNAVEITRSLFDVFTVRKDKLLENSKELENAPTKATGLIAKEDVKLDFEYLKELLATSYVPSKEVSRSLNTLRSLALVYGLNEPELVNLLEQALNVKSDTVDLDVLKKLAAQKFDSRFNNTQVSEKSDEVAEKQAVSQEIKVELTKQDQDLADVCRQYLPLEFIEIIKKQKHSFVNPLERSIITEVVKKKVLPDAVINVLLHYYLIANDNATLTGATGNKFNDAAARLAEQKLKTPEEAMLYMRKANQEALERRKQRANGYYPNKRAVVQKETLPEWAKQKKAEQAKKKQEKIKQPKEDDKTANAEIDALLAKLEETK